MPELPEVETIKRELEKTILHKKISQVCIETPKIIRQAKPAQFKKALEGATIKQVLRRAKALIVELSNGQALLIHLKMTGQLIYPGSGKNARVIFKFSDGSQLDFRDQRMFAEIHLLRQWQEFPFIKNLGPEPFQISLEEFKAMLAGKNTQIKPLLMDQTFISGIGNLYAAEALFRARIHPQRRANSLLDKEKEILFKEIKDTLNQAIKYKGSSVDQYLQLSGQPGGYVKYHKVYDREGKPCLVCKTPIKRITQAGRGTYFCSKCQR